MQRRADRPTRSSIEDRQCIWSEVEPDVLPDPEVRARGRPGLERAIARRHGHDLRGAEIFRTVDLTPHHAAIGETHMLGPDAEDEIAFRQRLTYCGNANFAIAEPPLKLVLIENPGHGGSINHLGVEVESSEKVHAEIGRLTSEGLFTEEEIGTTCCFATQDKVWVTGPGDEKWEVYTVLADSETFGATASCC